MALEDQQISNEQLIKNYLVGDEKSLRILIGQNLKLIYNFISRLVGDAVVAEDLTQEVFVKVWLKIKKFDQNKNFKTWLFTIAKNTAFDWLRKKKEIPLSTFSLETGENLLLDTLADEELLPSELIMQKEDRQFVRDMLLKLSIIDKTILELYFQEDFKLTEIATILKMPENTVKSRYRRSLMKLRRLLEQKSSNAPWGLICTY